MKKVDAGLAYPIAMSKVSVQYHDVNNAPFSIHGVFYENGRFRRLPEDVARKVSEDTYILHTNTAGGRVKFVTDSDVIAIKAVMPQMGLHPNCTFAGSAGFDLYANDEYRTTFMPPMDAKDGYESAVYFNKHAEREITINFPLFSDVAALQIGLNEGASLKPSAGYKHTTPIVFYGSSITQGGCASRPGNIYENIVCRELKSDYVNLGFSGSARAEDAIAEYISTLDMSVFVYDYDYNAYHLQHLQDTHQKMFLTVREKNPTLPIVMMSRPKYRLNDEEKKHLEVIRKTYTAALAAGDKNVYLIEGPALMRYAKNDCSVDGAHPNDLGFYSMAKVLLKQLKTIIH